MDEKIFDRIEKKYLISKSNYNNLHEIITKYMQKDNYYKSEIYNIYFDTDNYDLIIQSIERPVFKEKLRARSYGGYNKVFLEIKTKIMREENNTDNNIGYKRRILITKQDYDKLIDKDATVETLAKKQVEEQTDAQIAREIDYLIDHFDLKPKILLYYNRESYINNDKLRITFDSELQYRTKDLNFSKKSTDKHYFNSEKNIIMEIKSGHALPLWLVRTLSKEHIYPEQFSKIGKIYEQIRKEK